MSQTQTLTPFLPLLHPHSFWESADALHPDDRAAFSHIAFAYAVKVAIGEPISVEPCWKSSGDDSKRAPIELIEYAQALNGRRTSTLQQCRANVLSSLWDKVGSDKGYLPPWPEYVHRNSPEWHRVRATSWGYLKSFRIDFY